MPIFVEESVIENAKTMDPSSSDRADADRLRKWLDSLDPDDPGKNKMLSPHGAWREPPPHVRERAGW